MLLLKLIPGGHIDQSQERIDKITTSWVVLWASTKEPDFFQKTYCSLHVILFSDYLSTENFDAGEVRMKKNDAGYFAPIMSYHILFIFY